MNGTLRFRQRIGCTTANRDSVNFKHFIRYFIKKSVISIIILVIFFINDINVEYIKRFGKKTFYSCVICLNNDK